MIFFKIKVKSIFSNISSLFLLVKLLIINKIERQIIPKFKNVGAVLGPTTPSPVVTSENSVDLISNNKNKLIMSKANPEEKLKFLNLSKLFIFRKKAIFKWPFSIYLLKTLLATGVTWAPRSFNSLTDSSGEA